MTPSDFNTKLTKLVKAECMWLATYDTLTYKVSVHKAIEAMKTVVKSDSRIGFGVGTSLEKAFEDCLESMKKSKKTKRP